jgi:Domain of unknown function (DUF2357)/PD-(D/E)XK nuclease superfamily
LEVIREQTAATALEAWRADGETHLGFSVRPAPASNRGFEETGSYYIAKPGAGWSFRVDDEALEEPYESVRPAWCWSPGFFAGEVTAELIRPDGRVAACYLLDVSPHPSKLGRDVYAQMVRELWSEDPALVIGSEPATVAIGSLGAREEPWLAFWRLRRYAREALAALRPIRARPRRGLVPRRQVLPARRVRTIDRQTTRSALKNPEVIVFAKGGDLRAAEIRLDCPHVEETLDTSANRCLFTIFRAVDQRARSLLLALEMQVDREEESQTRTILAKRWPARRQFLIDLTQDLTSEMRTPPFSDVTRAEISAAGLNAIAADPAYARAYNLAWRSLRHGVSGPPTKERLWMSPSWEIYERWCFVALGRLLQRVFTGHRWEQAPESNRWLLRGTSRGGSQSLELSLQPVFRSEAPSRLGGRWSVSMQRQPDILLTERRGEGTRFWIFDAKYRSSRKNVLDAMTSAHVYQDSLRVGKHRAEASWLVVPRGGGAPWLEDQAFQEAERVGVHVLTPGEETTLPTSLLEAFDR